jgi:Gram-negative bacterial TonB protein C-terminal
MAGIRQRTSIFACVFLAVLAAVPAAAGGGDDVAAARQAYAKAGDAADRERAAMDLAVLLLARANHRTAQMAGDAASHAAEAVNPAAKSDLSEAEGLFRGVATGGGSRAEKGEAGLLAVLVTQGAGRDQDTKDEIQRLRQRDPLADSVLCLAMESLLPADKEAQSTVADMINERMQALAPGASYLLPSNRVSKPEALTHPAPEPSARHERPTPGVAVVQVLIDPQGHVAAPLVLEPGSGQQAARTLTAFKNWTFRPGLLDGKPVSVCYKLTTTINVMYGH